MWFIFYFFCLGFVVLPESGFMPCIKPEKVSASITGSFWEQISVLGCKEKSRFCVFVFKYSSIITFIFTFVNDSRGKQVDFHNFKGIYMVLYWLIIAKLLKS